MTGWRPCEHPAISGDVCMECGERVDLIELDDEVRGYIELARRSAVPRLLKAGWVWRIEGEDGLGIFDLPKRNLRIIHSIARELDEQVWAHVSVSRRDRTMPTWEQTRDAWWLIYDTIPGVIVVAPRDEHVNIAEVSHVWGCLTAPAVPDFTRGGGSI